MTASSPQTLNTPRTWLVDIAACATAGVVLGIIGPFGSFFNDDLIIRVAYWTSVLMMSGIIFGLALRWTWPRAKRVGLSVWVWGPVVVLVASFAPALLSRVLAVLLWPGIRHAVGLVEWYGQATLIGLVYVGLYIVLRSRRPIGAGGGRALPVRQLPRRLDQSLVCLQMEDHYVRVHSDTGSELVLMSLSQAVAGLNGVEGLQTHRSWWVARAAVTGVVEEGRNLRLVLSNGLEAPISRARVADLRAAGWL
jgi:hypothetical protein